MNRTAAVSAACALLLLCISVIALQFPHGAEAQTASPGSPIAPARSTDWTHAGVAGGIVNRTNISTTLNPGATVAQISNAIQSCNNGVVFLNAGTYNLSGSITFGSKSNVTLRGAGANQTILKFSNAGSCLGMPSTVCIATDYMREPRRIR
jgi:hypothetical protein